MIGLAVKGIDRVASNMVRTRERLREQNKRSMKRATIHLSGKLRLQMTGPKTHHPFWGVQSPSKEMLTARTGITRASLSAGTRVYESAGVLTGAVGSSQKHLLDHETGGIFPGKSPKGYHRIPTAAAQTRVGVDRWLGMSIRDIPGAFLFRSSVGKLWAAVITGGKRSQRITLLYLLVKWRKLPARRIFGRVRDKEATAVNTIMGEGVASVVRQANA